MASNELLEHWMGATDPSPIAFKKVDLHIHTRFSRCYVDHVRPEASIQTAEEQILQAALAAGLDAIAITDHNGVEAVDAVRMLARGSGITVFPGAEISARGGHCLAIFDADAEVDVARDLLLALGLRPEDWGNGSVRSEHWLDEVGTEISRRGGLAIAAHVDREPNGFLASSERPKDKQRIYHHPDIIALEVTDPASARRYTTGADVRYRLPRPCVQSSDAHAPDEIGRRSTLLRLEHVDLSSIRSALADFRRSVQLPGQAGPE